MAKNLYADLDMWERQFSYDEDLASAPRQELENVIEAAARDCDIYCHTHFYSDIAAIVLDGTGTSDLILPDLLSVTDIKLDENRDRTFELTLVASDYKLWRPNHPRPYDTTPYRRVSLDPINGNYTRFLAQEELVEITGEWGFTNDTEDTGDTVQDGVEQDATQTTLDVVSGPAFSVGQMLLLGAEQEYVSAIAANELTVARAQNGTTGATHANGLTISRYVYTPGARQACLIQAARIWKRREAAFQSRNQPSKFQGFDEDAARLLGEFVRYDI